ncbi:MAG: hypothetical protein JST73_02100 [Actinobacteria bacterium]|nr:hypothetical protein [Actinomycetota bacterium]
MQQPAGKSLEPLLIDEHVEQHGEHLGLAVDQPRDAVDRDIVHHPDPRRHDVGDVVPFEGWNLYHQYVGAPDENVEATRNRCIGPE